jgi:Mor family transcriptional regulator
MANKGIKLTTQLKEFLSQDYLAGMNGLELAKKYDLPKSTVYRALNQMDLNPERKDNLFGPRVLSEDTKIEIADKFKGGISIRELQKEYQMGYATLLGILADMGLKPKQERPTTETKVIVVGNQIRTFLSEGDQLAICEKYKDGPQTKQELATEYHVHIDTISAALRRHGVTVKKYIPEEIVDQFCHDFEEGTHTMGELTRIYRLSPETIRYWLVKRGMMKTPAVSLSLQDVETLQAMSPVQFKKWCREKGRPYLELLDDMVNNPETNERTRAWIIFQVLDHGFGKPKEEEPEETQAKNTTTKVLELISNKSNIFSKS